jgi:hypothetical protein
LRENNLQSAVDAVVVFAVAVKVVTTFLVAFRTVTTNDTDVLLYMR